MSTLSEAVSGRYVRIVSDHRLGVGIGLVAAAITCLLAYGGLVSVHLRYGTLVEGATWEMLAWVALAFGGYVAALCFCERARGIPPLLLWGGAILFHLLMLATPPTLSNDVYRYLWDGHVANHGISPYAYAIEDTALDSLAIPARSLANHTWMASPYLPAAQWLFGLTTALLPHDAWSMQVVMTLVNLGAGVVMAALLAAVGLPRHRLLIYLWNPLVVIETAHGAHVDVWMVLLTMAALWLWVRYGETGSETAYPWSGRTAAAVTLALATLTKIMPGLMVPVLFWRWKWRWLLVYGTTVAFFVIAAGMRAGWGLVGPLDGRGLFGALRIYGDQWNYNGGLFHWLEMWLWLCSGIPFGEGECLLWAKRIVTVLMMIGLGVVWLRARYITSARELIRICSVPLMLYLLLTTTVHPWYLLIVVAFLPFVAPGEDEPGRLWWWVVPWLYLSGALFLSYLTYLDLANLREYEWVRRTEWLPVLAMLAINSVMWFWQRKQSNNRAIG